MTAKELLANKAYPPKIKNHPVFKTNKSITKIFPLIGLENSSKDITLEITEEAKNAADALVETISETLKARSAQITKAADRARNKTVDAEKQAKISACLSLLNGMIDALDDRNSVVNLGNKITLSIPIDISVADKVILRKGERLFGAYNKLNEMLVDGGLQRLPVLDKMPAFKTFSSLNIPTDGGRIIFASDGEDGLWDIATMSMRGIESCQSWTSDTSSHIVGSMVDPFTGIIYMTSGAPHKNLGPKMMRRCVVRFIVNDRKVQALFLERMYPQEDSSVHSSFKKFLEEKTGGKFKVHISSNRGVMPAGYFVPLGGFVKLLEARNQPYRDSGIPYKMDEADHIGKFKVKSASIASELANAIGVKLMAGLRNAPLPESSKETFKIIRGTHKSKNISHFIYSDIVSRVQKLLASGKLLDKSDPYEAMAIMLKEFGSGLEKFMVREIKTATKTNLKRLSSGNLAEKVSDDIVDIFGIVAKQAAGKVSEMLTEQVASIDKEKAATIKAASKNKSLYLDLLN